MTKKRIGLIPAAGKGSRMLSLTDNFPKAMIPINGKPIIGHHLDYFLSKGYKDVCIVIGYKSDKIVEYVDLLYKNKFDKVTYVSQTELNGLGGAVDVAVCKLSEIYEKTIQNIFIILGDTLLADDITEYHDKSNVYYKDVEPGTQSRWCMVKTNNADNISSFMDKPSLSDINVEKDTKALIGVYNFTNIPMLLKSLKQARESGVVINGEFQLSTAMEYYIKNTNKMIAIEASEWNDVGEIETYIESKKNMTRFFNNIEVTNYNTIIKTSEDFSTKINDEIDWYLNIDNKLRTYTPQLIDFCRKTPSYELEFVNFNTIATKFMYDNNDTEYWRRLFNKTFSMLDMFKSQSNKTFLYNNKQSIFEEAVIHKLFHRIEDTRDLVRKNELSEDFKNIFNSKILKINGCSYSKITEYDIRSLYAKLFSSHDDFNDHFQIIHGDLFFGNMLFDSESGTLKVIDPKGKFGERGVYGDVRYDLAKLCHSITGKYDYIANDLFIIYNKDAGDIQYKLLTSNDNQAIEDLFFKHLEEAGYDKNQILFITMTLFLSMIPLHIDSEDRCILFYLTATQLYKKLLNNIG